MQLNFQKYTQGDRTIWAVVFLFSLMSLPLIYSTTNTLALEVGVDNGIFLFKQFVFIIIGLITIYFIHRLDYKIYSKVGVLIFYISIPLLIYTYLFGISINDASRWISIPGTGLTIQTSEIAKIGLILYLCRYLAKSQEKIYHFKSGFVPALIPIGITIALIAPANLSTATYVFMISLIILYIARARLKHLLLTIFIGLLPILLITSWVISAHHNNIKADVMPYGRVNIWINRVDAFLYDDEQKQQYQVQQSKIAIVKGGLLGVGPGNSDQKNFLPSAFSDYIFSMIIEEYGIIGSVFVILLYLILTYRSIQIFRKCEFAFGALIAIAFSMNLLISALFNMAVNAHILPVTGITLPFLSKGGTSFIIACIQVGIILSVSRSVKNKAVKSGKKSVENNLLKKVNALT